MTSDPASAPTRAVPSAVYRLLTDAESLTGEGIAAVLERLGRGVARQAPGAAFPRVWRKDDLLAGTEGDAPQMRFAVTLWEREVDEEAGFDALEALYDESAQVLGRIAHEAETGVLAGRLARLDGGRAADPGPRAPVAARRCGPGGSGFGPHPAPWGF
ncbi:hypothetical protein ACIRBZ_21245 [Streptomyces sp. NPDC094038]|uniref:hypothetical protein n=1 Tax=Streptomyces sp. NPDC094038 TaxID=3366055 RepID=UPI003809EDA3